MEHQARAVLPMRFNLWCCDQMVFPALIAPYSTVQAVKGQSGALSLDEQGTSWQLLSTHLNERLGRVLLVVERIFLNAMGTGFMDQDSALLGAG